MTLLGQLGIDPTLLVAQIINFAILAWLLYRLLYRPLVERIEHDEQELKTAEQGESQLKSDRTKLEDDRTTIIAKAQQRARDIVAEAEDIAHGITGGEKRPQGP